MEMKRSRNNSKEIEGRGGKSGYYNLTITVKMLEKENSLTFHNISQTMRLTHSKKPSVCCEHPNRAAKYRDLSRSLPYCTPCAIQEASRGATLQELPSLSPHAPSLLQEIYQQAQSDLQHHITTYNQHYQKLLDALTDMQIRDLITFNRKLEENQHIFKQLKLQPHQWDCHTLAEMFALKDADKTIMALRQLTLRILPNKTRNQYRSPTGSTAVSPKRFVRNASPQMLIKNRSQPIKTQQLRLNSSNNSLQDFQQLQINRQSFAKSQPNTGSQHSKTSTIEQVKQSALEDTPESVKDRVSQRNLRVTADMAVTMFEKIDVCESINLQQSQGQQQSQGKQSTGGSVCSAKSRHRYQPSKDQLQE